MMLIIYSISTCIDALALGFRNDLSVEYLQMLTELAGSAKDGIDIMIKHQWVEEAP